MAGPRCPLIRGSIVLEDTIRKAFVKNRFFTVTIGSRGVIGGLQWVVHGNQTVGGVQEEGHDEEELPQFRCRDEGQSSDVFRVIVQILVTVSNWAMEKQPTLFFTPTRSNNNNNNTQMAAIAPEP